MIQLSVAEIASAVGGRPAQVPLGLTVAGDVVTDSRLVTPGAVFVAIHGERTDGHDHVAGALAAGAALVLASRPVDGPHILVLDTVTALGELARAVLARLRAGGELQVVGITGSVGKTTTKDLLAQVLSGVGPTVAPRESFNNEIGLPLTVLSANALTRYLVLEMGASAPGHIDYLTRIAPLDVAVVLVVGHAHMGGFGSIETVATAKAEIVAGLAAGGVAVLNADDARVAAMAAAAPGPVLRFGRSEGSEVRAVDVTLDDDARAAFTLVSDAAGASARHPVGLALHGEHQVTNALAVAGAAIALGLDAGAVAARLGEVDRVSAHRMALTRRPDGVRVLDDAYNANPDSMAAALRALAAMPARRRLAVLGEMLELGHGAEREHAELGRLAATLGIDVLVAPGEAGAHVAAGAAAAAGATTPATHVPADADAAKVLLDELLTDGDLVLLKGSNGSGIWRLAEHLLPAQEEESP